MNRCLCHFSLWDTLSWCTLKLASSFLLMVSALAITGMMLTLESSFFMQTRSMLFRPWPFGVMKYKQP